MTEPSVIMYGPQGVGKTFHAERIAKHFGLARIVDGGKNSYNYRECKSPQPEGTLYITDEKPKKVIDGVIVVSFDRVAADIGIE